jgi:hypothetical protein
MRNKWDELYPHERYFAAMEKAAPDLYAAAVKYLERFDSGLTTDSSFLADMMRKPVEQIRAALAQIPPGDS